MRTRMTVLSTLVVTLVILARSAPGQLIARDPGVRRGAAGAGAMLAGRTATQQAFFRERTRGVLRGGRRRQWARAALQPR